MTTTSTVATHELLIIGAGAFGAIAASLAEEMNANAIQHEHPARWDVIGYADRDVAKRGKRHAGYVVRGTVDDLGRDFYARDLWFFCAIAENNTRAKIVRSVEQFGWRPATLLHPTAVLAGNVEIGPGSYVGPLAVISVNAKIGAHVIIETHVSIGNDAVLKDFCAVFPGARISGCCHLGEYALIGSNATLLPGTVVGDRAVVGASSLTAGPVEPETTVLGVPARILCRRTSSPSRH